MLIAPVAGFAQVTAVPVQSAPVVAAGATTPRTLAQRFADTVNVLDFGADPTGAADSQPACAAAIASVPSGTAVRLLWPRGTYRLNTGCVSNGRFVTAELVAGASVGSNTGGLGRAARSTSPAASAWWASSCSSTCRPTMPPARRLRRLRQLPVRPAGHCAHHRSGDLRRGAPGRHGTGADACGRPRLLGAPCSVGQQASDAGTIYLCTATNTCKRAALAAW